MELIKDKLHERCFFLFNDVLVRAKRVKSDRRLSLHDVIIPGLTTTTTPSGSSSSSSSSNSATSSSSITSATGVPTAPSSSFHSRDKWEFLEKVPLRDIDVINRDDDGGISALSLSLSLIYVMCVCVCVWFWFWHWVRFTMQNSRIYLKSLTQKFRIW